MDPESLKIWSRLKYYHKEQIDIKITYNRITVSGIIIKIQRILSEPYIILKTKDVKHKIFIEEVLENSIFPSETELEDNFIKPSYNRKSIPKSVRNEIWRDRFGDKFHGRCYVCKVVIRRDRFEAGHVVSANDGGKDTADNLRPICRTCNRSMGT